ncbi:MAG TPA: ABC transporter substrate-binding protein [Stellaceae bacterium]|jgi:branched-chain amino acid transport system substrate-binding protein|nr:ABC transporter substrate-binding protein [Stellaceae bacterium]
MSYRKSMLGFAAIAAAAAAMTAGEAAADENSFKLGVVTFLSGQAAESFGVPAWNSGKMVIDALNKGGVLPKPYDKPGFGGLKIEAVVIDENGGATKQVQELRNAYERDQVDAIVGYVGSGDCLAVSPAAEELKKLLILYDCGTPRIFEENKFHYVFRTAAHGAMDNVAMARYIAKRKLNIGDMGAINQDYAWGQDSWKDFKASMAQLDPDAKATAELWPKFGAGQYGTEISTLLQEKPSLVYSSLWGGDLQALVLQAVPRGLFKDRYVVLSASDHVLQPLGDKMPDGVIIGARGANGQFAERSPLNDWFVDAYKKAYPGTYPVQPQYRMIQALLGIKTAVETAMAANGGKKPSTEELAAAMTGLEWDAPSGHIKMALGDGHQAIQPNAVGRTQWDAQAKMVKLVDIEHFIAECVNPPANMKAEEWISKGFPGAQCE